MVAADFLFANVMAQKKQTIRFALIVSFRDGIMPCAISRQKLSVSFCLLLCGLPIHDGHFW